MEIRAASPADAAPRVEILSDWIEEMPWMPHLHSHASMVRFWGGRLAAGDGWVAVDDGRVVGFCLCDDSDVIALYLRPEVRRGGLGTMLLDRAKAGRAALGLWVFAANEPARRFYERGGFTEIERTEGDNEEGLPDIRMLWSRTPEPTR